MANKNDKSNAHEPRAYQLELLEHVMKKNSIIYLPTGAGKTFVAILALRRYSPLMQDTIPNGGKRAIFMCHTVELARQQALEVRRATNLTVGLYIGIRGIDTWTRSQWSTEIDDNQVLVGTPQVFLDIVSQNMLRINDLCIVIIDECHHATKHHPMHEFMRLFQHANQDSLPRVVGLTGVLIKSNKLVTVLEELNNLEATFRGNIVTVNDQDQFMNVMTYSTTPKEHIVRFIPKEETFPLETLIIDTVDRMCEVIESFDIGVVRTKYSQSLVNTRLPNKKNYVISLVKDFLYQMDDFGLYAASVAIMSPIIDLEIKRRQAETLALRNLYRLVITQCEYIRHLLVSKLRDAVEEHGENSDYETVDIIENYSTPKLRALFKVLLRFFSSKKREDICCLIFVERRYTAKCLFHVLQKYIEQKSELKDVLFPQFMIGRNSVVASIENTLDSRWNKKAIDQFRTKECNLIVCSNVLEEGIDVQACNHVFVVDQLRKFSSYIQTKGRARSAGSQYLIFTSTTDHTKLMKQVSTYKEMHAAIRKYLLSRIVERELPSDEIVAGQFTDVMAPLILPSGATLLPSSALALLNRYCLTLPTDSFSVMMPHFSIVHNHVGSIVVAVKLPLQSRVKEIVESDPMPNTKLAKTSAALNACKRLYEEGELNDQLLPLTKRECVAKVGETLFQHWKKHHDDVVLNKVGKQNLRSYKSMCPEQLYDALPVVGELCYAYEIFITPKFEENDYNSHIFNSLKTPRNYAILLRNCLPKMAEMPLFMNQGPLNVKICETPIECCVTNANQLQQLVNYHLMLFRDLLSLWKNFFALDKSNKEYSYLVAPLRDGGIDWELVQKFQKIPKQHGYKEQERAKLVFRPEDWMGSIINKWYSSMDSERYLVTKVRPDLTPDSAFEGGQANYSSYADFVETRYRNEVGKVMQKDQFLIEVVQLTSRRNFFINAVGKGDIQKKNRSIKITLIPETCYNYEYPGDMWIKALLVPSILHRLRFILHAENIRTRFNTFLGIESTERYSPAPLTIDKSLRRAVDHDGNAVEMAEKYQSKLAPLPTKNKKPASDWNKYDLPKVTWKDYMEPNDFTRNAKSLYSVEIDYYFNFISGYIFDIPAEDVEDWTNSQFQIGTIKQTKSTLKNNGDLPAIENTLPEQKRYIDMLARSLKGVEISAAEQADFVAALTTSGANDVFDMERFELLGDSFLKFAVSLYLCNKFPTWHEGFLTEVKSKLVSNRNLLYCMLDLDIPVRISSSLFKPATEWLPPLVSLPINILDLLLNGSEDGIRVSAGDLYDLILNEEEVMSGKCSDDKFQKFLFTCKMNHDRRMNSFGQKSATDVNCFLNKVIIADKIIADTLEALLGVCVKNYGIYRAFKMLDFFGICKDETGLPLTNLLDLKLGSHTLRTNISSREVDGFLVNYQKLEENLGYKFRDRAYLLQALTHPSYPTNRITGCYQELEFIGDAILDFLVSCYIFEQCKHMTPGMMTDLRSALVNNITLGCVCVRHRFHLFLLAENSALAETIKAFANFQESEGHRVTDQVRILMEETQSDDENDETAEGEQKKFNMSTNIEVPKALGDIVEAIIAAVYLDCRDLLTTWQVIYHLLVQEFEDFSQNMPVDPVRLLYENINADAQFMDPVVERNAVMVQCQFNCMENTVSVNGFGSNIKQAKKSAAKHALRILKRNS